MVQLHLRVRWLRACKIAMRGNILKPEQLTLHVDHLTAAHKDTYTYLLELEPAFRRYCVCGCLAVHNMGWIFGCAANLQQASSQSR
eukprot:scaffold193902_cov16-Tisochrysis_lutea.AAC.1